MFCGECGTQNPDANQFCKNCGKPLRRSPQAPAPQPVVPAQAVVSPVTQVPVQTAAAVKQPWSRGKKVAVLSIICGIGAFLVIPYILGIIGIILGMFALKEKYIPGIAGIIISIAAMVVNYLYIFL